MNFRVPAESKVTIRAGFALTRLCRVADMVMDGMAQTLANGQFLIGVNSFSKL
jgi:hypothetical protein